MADTIILELPKKGCLVPNDVIKRLCLQKGYNALWQKIWKDPPPKPFMSDGCSMWPDSIKGWDLYPACFFHDLKYWCGHMDEIAQRLKADLELALDVLKITGSVELTLMMFKGVRFGGSGHFKMRFSWGFGRA